MEIPASSAEANSVIPTAPINRRLNPIAIATKPSATASRRPITAANLGTSSANSPMHSTGTVVNVPRTASFHPVCALISVATAGRLDSASRRFNATSTTTDRTAALERTAAPVLASRTGGLTRGLLRLP